METLQQLLERLEKTPFNPEPTENLLRFWARPQIDLLSEEDEVSLWMRLSKCRFLFARPRTEISNIDETIIVWQYVRFNENYRRDFSKLVDSCDALFKKVRSEVRNQAGLCKNAADGEFDSRLNAFIEKWALFPLNPSIVDPTPYEFARFARHPVRKIGIDRIYQADAYALGDSRSEFFKILRSTSENILPSSNEVVPLFLAINPFGDTVESLLKAVESHIVTARREAAETVANYTKAIRQNLYNVRSNSALVENFVCHYYKNEKKWRNRDIKEIYKRIFGFSLQDGQLNRAVTRFKALSKIAPLCFMLGNRNNRKAGSSK